MKKRKRRVISTLLVLTLSLGMGMQAQAVTIDEAKQKADQLTNQKNEAQNEQNQLASQLNAIIKDMEDARQKLAKKQEEIQQAEDELVLAKVNENDQYESMKKRIKFMYENGSMQILEVLVECRSISDFLNKAEYAQTISKYDRQQLTVFQEAVKQVEAEEAALKQEYQELEVLQNNLIVQQDNVQKLLEEKKLQVSNLEKEIGDNANLLQTLIKQAEEERKKQEQLEASKNNNSNMYVPPTSDNVVSGSGRFTNPCPGAVVSSPFGYRSFDHSFHRGVDLAAPQGTPTYAAGDGYVMYARWSDSAGLWVVINHGDGFVTKYMHHSALTVAEGTRVSKGQQIGLVGNTGNSFGAHLHFQVELNGKAVDPQLYY